MKKVKSIYIVFGIALLASIYFVIGVRSKKSLFLDEILADWATSIFRDSSYPFFKIVTELGDKIGIGIVALLMLFWLWFKKRDYIGMGVFVLAVALSNEVSKWIKELVGRERPLFDHVEAAETLSFPSGHAMVGLTLYMLTAYFLMYQVSLAKIKWGIGFIAFILVFLIGLSRIVLQVHFSTDVLSGYSFGLIWTILWIYLYEWLYDRFPRLGVRHRS
ncbi:phosphatase PAP2 family protein [Bacillus sp. V3B]|uniref:phosphatase PAP2 family protein n=1 Tax=Bacillus sp. V3B TaxID=2804915 RepID=UPI002109B225|nr:phosphatase PAP2 family protein [Bacillus sp. V3B]MCQ6273407.1 phosphatase PAP2 family protein [Bacillus sp. V3B]